jgi:para-nitrobenzyl esterase
MRVQARPLAVLVTTWLFLGVAAVACSSSPAVPDGAGPDGGGGNDTGTDSTPTPDMGQLPDGQGPDGAPPDAIVSPDADGGPSAPTVTTDKGPVTGTVVGTTQVFYNIPYAAPPLGPLRWKPPQPAAAWTSLDATRRGPRCPQYALGTTQLDSSSDEDCLQLNVWVPQVQGAQQGPLPVMFWIHGGGFTIGSAVDTWYDGRKLAEATGNIVVSINYRLGPLGFLALAALDAEDSTHPVSGNYGLEDQRAAMAWVKTNIAAFGGNPAQVTIFGESAGGTSVCHHLLSPLSANLFAGAIIESGPCDAEVSSSAPAHAQGDAFVQAIGCNGASDVLQCLRGKEPQATLDALGAGVLGVTGQDGVWQPSVDGVNLPDHPRVLLDQGQISQAVPVILGNNKNEGTIFVTAVTDDASYQATVHAMLGTGQLADDVLAEYPSSDFSSPKEAAAELLGDAIFVCTARRMARAFTGNGQAVYRYDFNYSYNVVVFPGAGSFHSAEIPFVFADNYVGHDLTTDEKPLSQAIQGYWGHFASGGDPNADGGSAVSWPVYVTAQDNVLQLDLTIDTTSMVKTAKCDFWDAHPLPR